MVQISMSLAYLGSFHGASHNSLGVVIFNTSRAAGQRWLTYNGLRVTHMSTVSLCFKTNFQL